MSLKRVWIAAAMLLAPLAPVARSQETPRAGAAAAPLAKAIVEPFVVKPYLQLGDKPMLGETESLVLLWHTEDAEPEWSVDVRATLDQPWMKTAAPAMRRVDVAGVAPHRVYRASLVGLVPGGEFEYQVRRAGEPVFTARARARKGAGQAHRFVAFGDCGANTDGEKAIAYQAYLARPDYVMIPGDIVYSRGQASEYRSKFWPVYNADAASPRVGAPLLRTTLFTAAPGNHDIANRDLGKYPDGLAYFLYWSQPLNGPLGAIGAPNTPSLQGPEANQKSFLDAAGSSYPRMANFSFDYGNVHWTILDANTYVDWTNPDLRSWVARDLANARTATWRFVCFHQPGFNSSKKHFSEQYMRSMAEVAQQNDPASWQSFTSKFISDRHSFTLVDVNGPSLTVRQVSSTGDELDRFRVTKD